jgi:hypothetical protein
MLDPLAQAFETEMKAKTTARPRPAATRRAELIDNSSAPGAAELGRRIQAFWSEAGFDIAVQIVHSGGRPESPIWGVRSDMIGGRPRSQGGRDGDAR